MKLRIIVFACKALYPLIMPLLCSPVEIAWWNVLSTGAIEKKSLFSGILGWLNDEELHKWATTQRRAENYLWSRFYQATFRSCCVNWLAPCSRESRWHWNCAIVLDKARTIQYPSLKSDQICLRNCYNSRKIVPARSKKEFQDRAIFFSNVSHDVQNAYFKANLLSEARTMAPSLKVRISKMESAESINRPSQKQAMVRRYCNYGEVIERRAHQENNAGRKHSEKTNTSRCSLQIARP
jgi:hypothetical protein